MSGNLGSVSIAVALIVCLGGLGWGAASASGSPTECPDVVSAKKNGAAVFSGSAFVILATTLEKQGKGNIKPSYSTPKSVCTVESFLTHGFTVTTSYSGFEPGMQTLLYMFAARQEAEQRQILVLYDGMVSLIQGAGPHFYVVETRRGRTSFYAMYGNEPAYPVLKGLIEAILSDSAKPLMAVEWPADSDELVIVAYDSDRLK